jgi:hypothetical protein
MLHIEAPHVGAPGAIQGGNGVASLGRRPPQPEGLGLAGLLGQTADLDEQERPAHDRASAARIALGMLAMGLGMQPGPRPHTHGAVLGVFHRDLIGGSGPGRRRITGELVAVATGPTGPGVRRRVGVEAAAAAQADQDGGRRVPQRLGEVNRIVAGVEEDPRQRIIGLQVREERRDCGRNAAICSAATALACSCGRSRRTRRGAVQLSRAKPTWAIQEEAQPATMGCPAEWRAAW